MARVTDSLETAIQLRQKNKGKQALAMLRRLLKKQPNDAHLNYHAAWCCDGLGDERAAVPYYETALELGLEGEALRGALLGLGSTYRTLGDYQKSAMTFRAGIEFFPEAREFQAFLAMACYNLGQHHEAMTLLLRALAETSDDEGIQRFKRALLFYSDKLDQVW
jgi:tetratricopeptide (TPR) repeat protein